MSKRKRSSFFTNLSPKQCLLLSSPFWLAAVASQDLQAATFNATDMATLRAAIDSANASGTSDTINIAAGTYTLTGAALENANASGDLDITKATGDLQIIGAGAGSTIIDGASLDRVFHINAGSGITVTIQDLTIQNGAATDNGTTAGEARGGGVLLEQGNLNISNVVADSNAATGAAGAVGSAGASGGGTGGTGGAGQAARGGAVYVAGGTVSISNSTLSGNSAAGGAGGVGGVGGDDSSVYTATAGTGGAGGAGGNAEGGAVYVAGGTVSLTASTISGGSVAGGVGGTGGAGGDAGGVATYTYLVDYAGAGGAGGAGGNASGAGVFVGAGTVSLINATVSGNGGTAGDGGAGGAGGNATGIEAGSTARNYGGDGGAGGASGFPRGGGIHVVAGTLAISNSTVAANSATAGTGGSGGAAGTAAPTTTSVAGTSGTAGAVQSSAGGGLHNGGATVTADSSIFADSAATSGADVEGNLTAGASLFEVAPNGTVTPGTGTNITGTDPVLSALANNGGPTQTHAIDTASAARDAGSNPLTLATDQRGFNRDDGGGVDMGAYEFGAGGAATTPPSVSDPASVTVVNATSYNIMGTAPADSLVRIYSDANNNGVVDGADAVVGSQQLTGGATAFSISVSLTQDVDNNFTATSDDGSSGESNPVNVPTITEDSTAPTGTTVTDPATALNTTGTTYTIVGTAEAGSTVQIYSDFNNNGVIDGADAVVASGTATGGNFSISTPITQSTTNNFTATASDAASNESNPVDVPTITETTAPAISPPIVSTPATTVTIDAAAFDIMGTAQADSLVRIYSDLNNDGFINGADAVVGSLQLTGGATAWTINVPLTQSATNSFLATAEDGSSNESLPTDVPDITESAGGTSGGGGGGGGGGCAVGESSTSSWLLFGGLVAAMFGLMRNVFRRQEG